MTSAIRTNGLSKTFGNTRALNSLDLEIPEGEVLGYLGPNGAGKTTTIRLLLGLIRATEGHAEIFGVDCQADPVAAHERIAYVPGEANLWPSLTGAETLHLLGRVSGRVDAAYRDVLIERFQLDPAKRVRAYSKGNRQKLLLIAGLMTRADLLLLDEPTSGLDPLMEQAFRACIDEAHEQQRTVRVAKVRTGSSPSAAVAYDRSLFHVDAVLREMSGEFVGVAMPYETQIAAARHDRAGSDQRSNVESGTVHIQLLVPEAEGDSTIGMIDNFRSQHVAVERNRPVPVADRNDHMI